MDKAALAASMEELVRRTCTELPGDVFGALEASLEREQEGSVARSAIETVLKSAAMSRSEGVAVCQDTGIPFATVEVSDVQDFHLIRDALHTTIEKLTSEGLLRPNCVDPLTERNTHTNTGSHVPFIHCEPGSQRVAVGFMLKGGGSENVSIQYSLPDEGLGAQRDLDGARRCILDAVFRAQGKGCAPGILGVCIGADRASGYLIAKKQLFRRLDDSNPSHVLSHLEKTILEESNLLGIGPMGLGGRTTLLGCKIACAGRHPACYYVTVSYSCWATRRYTVELDRQGRISRWL